MNNPRETLIRVALVVGAVIGLHLMAGGLLETLNRELYDSAMLWRSDRQPQEATPYVLVEIDDASIRALGRFPWSRDIFARLLEKTTEGNAQVVGIDVLFSEAADPAGDQALVSAIRNADNVVLASFGALARPGEAEPMDGPVGKLRVAERLLEPLPVLAEAAAGVGHISTLEDTDGALRRYPALVRNGEQPYPSLAQVMAARSGRPGGSVMLGEDGSILINYGALSRASVSRISFSDVLELDPTEALDVFSGKIVLVGATYTGGVDVAPSPLETRMPAAYSHIFALHTLVTGQGLTTLSWFVPFVLALIVVAILAGQIAGHHPLRVVATAGATIVVLLVGSGVFLLYGRVVLQPALPILAGIVFVSGYGLEEWRSNLSARRAAEAFLERFMGSRIRRRRLDESSLDMRATAMGLSVLSLRLSDHGEATRDMTPAEQVDLVRDFHQDMVDVIEEQGGTVDRLTADGLVAYWGYPDAHPDNPARAVAASQEMRSRILAMNDNLGDRFRARIRVRMGVSTGTAVMADIGSGGMADFTLLGPTVTLSSQLRDTAPLDGVHICQWTHAAARKGLPTSGFEQPAMPADGFDEPVVTFLLERPYRAWVDRTGRDDRSDV